MEESYAIAEKELFPNSSFIRREKNEIEAGRKREMEDIVVEPPKNWYSPPPEKCDLCSQPIKDKFIDGRVQLKKIWRFMCPSCHLTDGDGLGVGRGQEYTLTDGEWIRTDG